MVGSELKVLTMSNRLSDSTDPSNRRYVTLKPIHAHALASLRTPLLKY